MRRNQVSLRTIAEEVGVTKATVSRVLRDDKKCFISAAKKKAIMSLGEKYHYKPNQAARSLVTGRSYRIGFVLHHLYHLNSYGPFNLSMLEGLRESLSKKGYILSVMPISADNFPREIQQLCEDRHSYDGLIFGRNVIPSESVEFISSSEMPVVVHDDNNAHDTLSTVVFDQEIGIRKLVDHLLSLGHRRIGLVGRGPRMDVYKRIFRKSGVDFNERDVFHARSSHSYEDSLDAYVLAGRHLDDIKKFTAVCCVNDLTAMGLCRRLREEGLAIGRDISVTGFDDIEEILSVKENDRFLTTVHNPRRESGEILADVMLKTIKHENSTTRKEIPCDIVIRKSTGPAI